MKPRWWWRWSRSPSKRMIWGTTKGIKDACKRFHPGEKCILGRNHPAKNG